MARRLVGKRYGGSLNLSISPFQLLKRRYGQRPYSGHKKPDGTLVPEQPKLRKQAAPIGNDSLINSAAAFACDIPNGSFELDVAPRVDPVLLMKVTSTPCCLAQYQNQYGAEGRNDRRQHDLRDLLRIRRIRREVRTGRYILAPASHCRERYFPARRPRPAASRRWVRHWSSGEKPRER